MDGSLLAAPQRLENRNRRRHVFNQNGQSKVIGLGDRVERVDTEVSGQTKLPPNACDGLAGSSLKPLNNSPSTKFINPSDDRFVAFAVRGWTAEEWAADSTPARRGVQVGQVDEWFDSLVWLLKALPIT